MTAGASTQITDLAVNDHACLTYGEPEELLDLTAAFVRDGLSSGLKVVWLSGNPPGQAVQELARRGIPVEAAIAAGQMNAAAGDSQLLSAQAFAADHAMGWLRRQMTACRQEGYPGLRVAVDMSWALRPVTGIEQLPEFEQDIAAALDGTTVSVLCQYDRERFDPVTLASVTAVHTRSVTAATYYADAVLRICRQYAPPGIRLAGEIDYQAEEALALALAEAIRLDGDITINMAALAFMDAPCTRMIVDAARSVTPARRVILQCPPALAAGSPCTAPPMFPGSAWWSPMSNEHGGRQRPAARPADAPAGAGRRRSWSRPSTQARCTRCAPRPAPTPPRPACHQPGSTTWSSRCTNWPPTRSGTVPATGSCASGPTAAPCTARSPRGSWPGTAPRPRLARDHRPTRGRDQAAGWQIEHGHGLWLVHQVGDQARLHAVPGGSTVTVTFLLRDPG